MSEHIETYLNADQTLRIVEWAQRSKAFAQDGENPEELSVDLGPRPVQMANSPATGEGLITNGKLGADIIRLEAGKGFAPHTHPGDHLLIVLGGEGTITYNGKIYATRAGQIYMVEGAKPHAVGARSDHVILAVGSPHRAVDSPDRMALVEYRAVTAELGNLTCLLCEKEAIFPQMLHTLGCRHCPCPVCLD
jgi:quercetin dioxygenase-like cupin family protein